MNWQITASSLLITPGIYKNNISGKYQQSIISIGVQNMFGLGVWELTIIFAIVLLMFGGKKLPGIATGLGQAIRNFRSALKGEEENKALPHDNDTNR